jgi:hypothetical protein
MVVHGSGIDKGVCAWCQDAGLSPHFSPVTVRLWSKRTAAHDLLAEVYSWCTKGSEMANLQEAMALLDACSYGML